MSNLAVDIISDLHVDEVPLNDWSDQPTSPFCIVAGDVARDRNKLKHTLTHLSSCYSQVFYIDGNEEHRNYYDNLDASYEHLGDLVNSIPNTVFMDNNIVILNGVALVAVNGWWTFEFDSGFTIDAAIDWFCDYTSTGRKTAIRIIERAYEDAAYLIQSIKRLQLHPDVKSIAIMSHTLPQSYLASHDIDLLNSPRYNCLGNNYLCQALGDDYENKIKVWVCGHYHNSIDRELNGVRYVSNVRGRGNTPWFQQAYYPKRLDLGDIR